ncbi:unnamed protein product [Notodromas monacha]|uniref:Uncharacterized protein n=1 Tax=Notodromas monacha TaxID=399045 RepID=A0A7R9BWU9_9CRUS|nr:unnamed protein product [Notodromas monacha]CAG0921869.1 unnamed protein product [Notodromas monacha]
MLWFVQYTGVGRTDSFCRRKSLWDAVIGDDDDASLGVSDVVDEASFSCCPRHASKKMAELDASAVSEGDTNKGSQHFIKFSKELANMTRDAGDSVKLKCEVYGIPAPKKIRWYRNEVPIEEERGRIAIRSYNTPPPSSMLDDETDDYYDDSDSGKRSLVEQAMPNFRGSRLRITELDVLDDSGFYKCVATNGFQKISSTGIVKINPGGSFGRERQSATIPQYSLQFPPNFEGSYIDMDTGPSFSPDHGFGHNLMPPPVPDVSFGPNSPSSSSSDSSSTSTSGKCQVYDGATCALYVGNSSVYIPGGHNQALTEKRMTEAITVIASSGDLSKPCGKYAISALCYTTFPPCKRRSRLRSEPVYICRDECEILEHDICKVEYAIAKKHPLIGMQIKLPDCAELPPIASPASEDCLRIGIPRVAEIRDSDTCYEGKGEDYRGTMSRTASGHECVPWADKVRLNPVDHPELIGGHNFCRNPGAKLDRPWCFSSSYGQVQELCDIPRCDDHIFIYIGLSAVGLVAFVVLLVSLMCYRRHKSRSAKSQPTSPTKLSAKQLGASPLEMNALLSNGSNYANGTAYSNGTAEKRPQAAEISLSNVRFLQELGEGAFVKAEE